MISAARETKRKGALKFHPIIVHSDVFDGNYRRTKVEDVIWADPICIDDRPSIDHLGMNDEWIFDLRRKRVTCIEDLGVSPVCFLKRP